MTMGNSDLKRLGRNQKTVLWFLSIDWHIMIHMDFSNNYSILVLRNEDGDVSHINKREFESLNKRGLLISDTPYRTTQPDTETISYFINPEYKPLFNNSK